MAIVYKVLSQENKKLISAIIRQKGVCLSYVVGKIVRPMIKDSYILAFRTLKDAREFRKHDCSNTCVIYRAEATLTKRRNFPSPLDWDWLTIKSLEQVWQSLDQVNRHCWPKGTVFCKEITLLSKIEE